MILVLLDVVIPVFLVIGAGYLATRSGQFKSSAVDGLNVFTQKFAIPCLLFQATMTLDLAAVIKWDLLISFYAGATICFVLGTLGSRYVFGRSPGEAVAIGFGALFSNSVLLGLPITEQAYGADALGPNFAIVALHAPYCYILGISTMEALRADGQTLWGTAQTVIRMVARNALMIGIALGFLANFTGFRPPELINDALDLMVRAALPAALFGLGGVLTRYTISDKIPQVAMIATLSLFVHPAITFGLGTMVFDLPLGMTRSAVLTAAMAPGVNAYIFATMYNRGTDVNSSVVLFCTMASVLSVPIWLSIVG